MKKIFEKWEVYKQKCTQSDGDKGEYVSKKKETGEVVSCHATKEKAKSSNQAKYATKNEQLAEMSSAGGGAIEGYTGSPLGTKEDNEQFNENEKDASKLKGKKLEEMYSTAGQSWGIRISIVSAEKEHAGHVERSQHQGVVNVMKEDDDKTKPLDPDSTKPLDNVQPRNTKPPAPPVDPIAVLLDKNGYILKKKLGEGQYGVVVLATEKDEYGGHDFAIKILKDTGGEAMAREVRNYSDISAARSKDPQIAKHFPEVFDIFNDEGKTFIVMEVLEPLPGVVKGLFSGVEQLMHRKRPLSAQEWPIRKFDKDKDVSKRFEDMLTDHEDQEAVIAKVKQTVKNLVSDFDKPIDPKIKKDIDIHMAPDAFRNWERSDWKEADNFVGRAERAIYRYLDQDVSNVYTAIMDDLRNSPRSKVFVALYTKIIIELLAKHTVHPTEPDDDYDPEWGIKQNAIYTVGSFLQELQLKYRLGTSLRAGYKPSDFSDPEGGRLADAESIYQAIVKLKDATGLFARDLHDGNAMKRPGGDVVIVDVGMFKTSKELQNWFKESLRENRIRIKITR